MKLRKRPALQAGVVIECATKADADALKAALDWLPQVTVQIREARVVTFLMAADRVCSFSLILSQTIQRLKLR